MQKNERLQCRLDVYWLLHNFVYVHLTTKQVPAVALGIVTEGLSIADLFRLHCVYHRPKPVPFNDTVGKLGLVYDKCRRHQCVSKRNHPGPAGRDGRRR